MRSGMTTDRRLVDTLMAACAARVRPATIRSWAHRGKLTPHGTDAKGRTLYDLDDVYRATRPHARVDVASTNVQH